ncbi:leucyl aminopeptidase [Elongatibacter sediminis]|uniref:Probable cytosol aminopeptidase n=1 Tax=Elongatibacter sediminis TaxID=3119006 RepID=A0AAW9RI02_9GAMM
MQLSTNNDAAATVATPCLVIGIHEDAPLSGAAAEVNEASGGALSQRIESRDISGLFRKTTLLHGLPGVTAERILVVGLGKSEKLDRSRFNQACQAAGTFLRDHPVTSAHICLHDAGPGDASPGWRARQAALALWQANYRYTVTKPIKDDSPVPLESASFAGGPELQTALDQAAGMGIGFDKARELGDLPPNICNPAYLAQEARAIADRHESVSVEVLEEDQMAELGMDALLGVSRGSSYPAKLIILRHSGAGPDERPVVLVGKGITFDSGGLSLKSGDNMMQMKYDMCGAAGVMGALLACAQLGLPVNVITVVAAVENMPDGNAYRPGDVITSMSGQTVEVLNTDAEGRLVLCDALTYIERFEPQAVIDVATLTGACVVALGHHASGLLSNDDDLAADLLAAGDDVLDRAWHLPLWEEYQSQLDSPVADMKNVGGMSAGVVTAGCFLSRFARKQRWAHIDNAGSAWKWKSDDGATGRPVGLLTRYLMQVAGTLAP